MTVVQPDNHAGRVQKYRESGPVQLPEMMIQAGILITPQHVQCSIFVPDMTKGVP
jgi:hypothetical protein